MPIVILNHSPYGNAPDADSNAFLGECARWLSLSVRVLELESLQILPGGGIDSIGPGDVVMPRADIRKPIDLWLVQSMLRAIEGASLPTLVTSEALACAEDRMVMLGALRRAGLPIIPSAFVRVASLPPPDLEQIVARLGGFPVCMRSLCGWGGMGLLPCPDLATLRAACTYTHELAPSELVLLQPFVEHESAITVQMVGGLVVRSYRSFRAANETRTNPRFAGRVEECATLADPAEVYALAARSLAACGLTFGTVDILEARDGRLLVLEVNCAPGVSRANPGDRRFAEAIVRHAGGDAARRPSVRLVVPFSLDDPRGNSVSAGRIARVLRGEGVDLGIEVMQPDPGAPKAPTEHRNVLLVHAIQAWHTGPAAAHEAAAQGVPLVLSFRGTDLDALEQGGNPALALAAIARAARIVTVLTADQNVRLVRALPELESRIRVVPHGVELPAQRLHRDAARLHHGIATSADLVVQIAGVRGAKGLPESLTALDLARARRPNLEFRLAGPLLEPELGKELEAWFSDRHWARWLGPLSHERAIDLLAAADVSFHASAQEGLSNALLESLALGVPVVARDIAAARSVVVPQANGLLFADWDGAALALVRLLEDRSFAHELAQAGLHTVDQRFSASAELEGYLAAYRDALIPETTASLALHTNPD